jgi:hypothetical protein
VLFPPLHLSKAGLLMLTYVFGASLLLAGAGTAFRKNPRLVCLVLGSLRWSMACFVDIPCEFMSNSNYLHFAAWEDAVKELALCGGALLIAGCFPQKSKDPLSGVLSKWVPLGGFFFTIPIILLGSCHFLYTKEVSAMVPSWLRQAIFWTYFAGTALIGSGMAVIFKIKARLIAALLGAIIVTWLLFSTSPG